MNDSYEINIAETSYRTLRHILTTQNIPEDIMDDIIQETIMRACRNFKTLKDMDKIDGWLFVIAKHVIADYCRQKNNHCGVTLPLWDDFLSSEHCLYDVRICQDSLQHLIEKETSSDMLSAIQSLGSKYRRIIELHYFYGYKLKTISDVYNINYNTVKALHCRALKILRGILEKRWNKE